MKVLLIGGPRFVGYALTEALLEKGHEVTFFNRGKTNPDLFPDVEKIRGNRDGEIANIGNDQKFDVVIDTCGYVPRVVKQSVDFLRDKTSYYVFISSISVYSATKLVPKLTEEAEVFELEDKTTEEIMKPPNNYGGLKVLCERVVQEVFGDKAVIIRPGYIVGPNDPTHRFTYWPVRIRKGGKMLAPAQQPSNMQFVDARDLAEFTVGLLEQKKSGVYQVTGPNKTYDFRTMLEEINKIVGSKADFQWASTTWLEEQKVKPGEDLPLWDPSEEDQALMDVNIEKAVKDGLTFRSLKETVKDTLEWYDKINGDTKEWRVGLDQQKEQELVKKLSK